MQDSLGRLRFSSSEFIVRLTMLQYENSSDVARGLGVQRTSNVDIYMLEAPWDPWW